MTTSALEKVKYALERFPNTEICDEVLELNFDLSDGYLVDVLEHRLANDGKYIPTEAEWLAILSYVAREGIGTDSFTMNTSDEREAELTAARDMYYGDIGLNSDD